MDAATLQAIADLGVGRFAKLSCDERPVASHARQAQKGVESGGPSESAQHSVWNDATNFESDPRYANLADNNDYTGQTHRARLQTNMQYARPSHFSGPSKAHFSDRVAGRPNFRAKAPPARAGRSVIPRTENAPRAPSPRAAGTVKFVKGRRVDQDAKSKAFNQLLASAPAPPRVTSTPYTKASTVGTRIDSRAPSTTGIHRNSNRLSDALAGNMSSVPDNALQVRNERSNTTAGSAAPNVLSLSADLRSQRSKLAPAKAIAPDSQSISEQHNKFEDMTVIQSSPGLPDENFCQQKTKAHIIKIVELVALAGRTDDNQALHDYERQHPAYESLIAIVQTGFSRRQKTNEAIYKALKGTLSPLENYVYSKVEEYLETQGAVKPISVPCAVSAGQNLEERSDLSSSIEMPTAPRAAIAISPQLGTSDHNRKAITSSVDGSIDEEPRDSTACITSSPHGSDWSDAYIDGKASDRPGKLHVLILDSLGNKVEELCQTSEMPYKVDMTITQTEGRTEMQGIIHLIKTLTEKIQLHSAAGVVSKTKASQHDHKCGDKKSSKQHAIAQDKIAKKKIMPDPYAETSDEDDLGEISGGEWTREDADEYVRTAY